MFPYYSPVGDLSFRSGREEQRCPIHLRLNLVLRVPLNDSLDLLKDSLYDMFLCYPVWKSPKLLLPPNSFDLDSCQKDKADRRLYPTLCGAPTAAGWEVGGGGTGKRGRRGSEGRVGRMEGRVSNTCAQTHSGCKKRRKQKNSCEPLYCKISKKVL